MSDSREPTPFELAGGMGALEAILRTFYDSVFVDPMIGFLFVGVDRERLIQREGEFTAGLLGAPGVRYSGRPIGAAHASHPILGGHFERRTELLRQAMSAHGLHPTARAIWLEHTERLRPQVTRQAGSGCDHPPPTGGGLKIEHVGGSA